MPGIFFLKILSASQDGAGGKVKQLDYSHSYYISNNTTIREDGWIIIDGYGGNKTGTAWFWLNGVLISCGNANDGIWDHNINMLPVSKGDRLSFSGTGSYGGTAMFIPYK